MAFGSNSELMASDCGAGVYYGAYTMSFIPVVAMTGQRSDC